MFTGCEFRCRERCPSFWPWKPTFLSLYGRAGIPVCLAVTAAEDWGCTTVVTFSFERLTGFSKLRNPMKRFFDAGGRSIPWLRSSGQAAIAAPVTVYEGCWGSSVFECAWKTVSSGKVGARTDMIRRTQESVAVSCKWSVFKRWRLPKGAMG